MAFEDEVETARAYGLYSSSGMDKRIGELAWATVFRHLSQGVNSRLTLPLPSWECDWYWPTFKEVYVVTGEDGHERGLLQLKVKRS